MATIIAIILFWGISIEIFCRIFRLLW
jgi:hypothetical protein